MITVGGSKLDVDVRPIQKGQVATFEVDGTFSRRPAPCDGVLVEATSTTVLLPLTDLRKALAELERSRRGGDLER